MGEELSEPRENRFVTMDLVEKVIATTVSELLVEARLTTLLARRGTGSAGISGTAASSQSSTEETAMPATRSQLMATFPEETTR